MTLREWTLQDWAVNDGRRESQLMLAWFRLAQWSTRLGPIGRVISMPYWCVVGILIGVELPVSAEIGPRLRLYHPHSIVLHPRSKIGSDCHLRQGVTIGNTMDRSGAETDVPRLGDSVEIGVGAAIIGDLWVGDHARIGALAIVLKSVPAWAVVVGNPGRVVRVDQPDAGGV